MIQMFPVLLLFLSFGLLMISAFVSLISEAIRKRSEKIVRFGVVEGWDFSWGGHGNQWTRISGKTYATWWDYHTTDWLIGDKVSFKVKRCTDFDMKNKYEAFDIHRVIQ